MLKKLLAALMCITMATSFVACGEEEKEDKKDSSSEIAAELEEAKEEAKDKVDEVLEENGLELEEEQKDAVDSLIDEAADNQLEVGANAPAENNDTLGLIDILTSGKWDGYSIAVSGMEEMTLEAYAEMGGIDVSELAMSVEFTADGAATLTSATASDTGTYVVDAETVYMTDSTGAGVVFTYDEATGMLALDMLGEGSMIMNFAVAQ